MQTQTQNAGTTDWDAQIADLETELKECGQHFQSAQRMVAGIKRTYAGAKGGEASSTRDLAKPIAQGAGQTTTSGRGVPAPPATDQQGGQPGGTTPATNVNTGNRSP